MNRLLRVLSEEENIKNFGGKKAPPFKKEEGPAKAVVESNYFRATLKQDSIASPGGEEDTPVVDVMIEMLGSEGYPGDVDEVKKGVEKLLKKFDALMESEDII